MIYVFDDDPTLAEGWVMDLKSASARHDVVVMSPHQFNGAVTDLVRRQRQFTGATPPDSGAWGDCILDDADALVVDYELVNLEENPTLTGANVAFLARMFSRVKVIITLNRFYRLHGSKSVFDLDLTGHPQSNADIELQAQDLKNPVLWQPRGENGYRPSYWPRADVLIVQRDQKAAFATDKLDETIFDFLGFKANAASLLPRSVLEQLSDKDPSKATLRDFAHRCARREPSHIHLDDEQLANIVASRLGRWLEMAVLPLQDVLVDIPHIVERFPSVRPSGTELNGLIDIHTSGAGAAPSLGDAVDEARFTANCWLTRPAYWWPKMSEDSRIPEVREPWAVKRRDLPVFCEDASSFLPRNGTQTFTSALESSFPRRRVVAQDGTALGQSLSANVVYRPSIRLLQ